MKNGKYYCSTTDFLAENKNSKSKYFLLVAEYTHFELEDLSQIENEIAGAIVPFVIFDNEFYNKGLIACTIEDKDEFIFVDNLKTFKIDKKSFLSAQSLIVLLDGLSPNITNFLDDLFESVPENTQIMGGGAGKMTFVQEPVIFSKHKYYENSALVISLNSKIHIGIENAWEYLEGPFIATSSQNNVLKALNFRNAFEVYKEIVEKDSGLTFSEDNFFDIAKAYPLGIVKFDKGIVVRDPIFIDEQNNLVLVGDIPQNSTVNILKGYPKNIINSSGKAISNLMKDIKEPENYEIIVFNCISRSIFLGDEFNEELNEMKKYFKSDKKLYGALTLGEIANNGNEYITFYNKTCVVGLLC